MRQKGPSRTLTERLLRMALLFCDTCLCDVEANIIQETETALIRGVEVAVPCTHAICPECGSRIADPSLTDSNLELAYSAFRKQQNIPQPSEIKELREGLSLSQRQFSLLIGIGIASLQRYEQGSLPSESHAEILRNAFDLRYLKKRLREHAADFSDKDQRVIAAALDKKRGRNPRFEYQVISLKDLMPVSSGIFTGNVPFSSQKLCEAIELFACFSENLYKTKLNKALFYLDFSMFRDYGKGITGLQYAHANYGPVPDGYEAWMHEFVNDDRLYYKERANGGQAISLVSQPSPKELSELEIAQIKQVSAFIDSFPTVTQLSEASHKEDAWIRTKNGERISYEWARTLRGAQAQKSSEA